MVRTLLLFGEMRLMMFFFVLDLYQHAVLNSLQVDMLLHSNTPIKTHSQPVISRTP